MMSEFDYYLFESKYCDGTESKELKFAMWVKYYEGREDLIPFVKSGITNRKQRRGK